MNWKKTLIALFFACVVLLSALTFVLPKAEYSETENRTLAKTPVLSAASLVNKTFMNGTESYLSDYIVGRTNFVKARTQLEIIQGKKEINGVYICSDKLIKKVDTTNMDATNTNVEAINEFSKKYSDKMSISIMLAPTALEMYKSQAPAFSTNPDQSAYIKNVYGELSNVGTIDCYSSLSSLSNEYIYYRTDHHWTSKGAFAAYNAMSKTLGFKAATIDQFNIEHAAHNFLGTLYSKTLYGDSFADTVDIYHYTGNKITTDVVKYTGKNKQTYSSVFFREALEKKDKYQVFMGDNVGVSTIRTNVNNGKRIVIFKDSYANSLMQFLPLHYEEITLVDLRYLNAPLNQYIDLDKYSQALFLYNVDTFAEDNVLRKIKQY